PFGLEVGPLVPVDPEPGEAVQNGARMLLARSVAVGVLDPQHEDAAVLAGEQPVVDGRAGAAHVQVARGRGREADSHRTSSSRSSRRLFVMRGSAAPPDAFIACPTK